MTTSTNSSDCENAKVDGVTKPDSGANSPPAMPAQAADAANANTLTHRGSRPIDSAAVSESFTARMARPQAPALSLQVRGEQERRDGDCRERHAALAEGRSERHG